MQGVIGSLLFTARATFALGALVPPLSFRLSRTESDIEAHRLVQECARRVVRLAGCAVRVSGLEHLPARGQAMLVANHASLADAALLLAVLPFDFRFVANHASAAYPILGTAIRRASHHIVDRGSWRGRAECGQSMIDALMSGQSLLVFPEGTTADAGGMLPFRNGAFRAAARSGTPVVPIAVHGTRALMPPGSRLLAPSPIDIAVLAPLHAADGSRASVDALRNEAARVIAASLA